MTTPEHSGAQALECCPFCGDKRAAIHYEHDPDDFGRFIMVRCHGCGAQSQGTFVSHGNECPQLYSEVRAAWNRRHQPAAAQLAGWKLVPVEPTPEMVAAIATTASTGVHEGEHVVGIGGAIDAYNAMLDAAPPPPTQPKEPSNG